MNSGNCFVVDVLVAMSCQFPSNGGRSACFLGLIRTVTSCGLCNCTDFCRSVLCCLPNDILLLVNLSLCLTALFKLSFLVAFVLISIQINCSFHSCCPCAHCFSHHYSVACSASIVGVVPEFGYQALDSKLLFDSCYRPSRDFRFAPPFPLLVRKGTERGSSVPSVRTSRGFAVLDLLLPLLRCR